MRKLILTLLTMSVLFAHACEQPPQLPKTPQAKPQPQEQPAKAPEPAVPSEPPQQSIEPLLDALLKEPGEVTIRAALALAGLDQEIVQEKINACDQGVKASKDKQHVWKKIDWALLRAWLGSKPHLEVVRNYRPVRTRLYAEGPRGHVARGYSYEDNLRLDYQQYVEAKWGNVRALRVLRSSHNHCHTHWLPLIKGVLSRMPDGFPEFDTKADYLTRKRQIERMGRWFDKHEKRLAWDAEKQRYYLKPDVEKPKK